MAFTHDGNKTTYAHILYVEVYEVVYGLSRLDYISCVLKLIPENNNKKSQAKYTVADLCTSVLRR